MKTVAKVGIVVGGYVAAALLAVAAVALHGATSGSDAQASGGMSAFGDMILFPFVFGVAALVPTGLAFFFLRPYRAFWDVISGLGILIALLGLGATVLYEVGKHAPSPSLLSSCAAFSMLPILAAPVLALVFFVCAALSSFRTPKRTFLVATVMEGVVTGYMAIAWFGPMLSGRH